MEKIPQGIGYICHEDYIQPIRGTYLLARRPALQKSHAIFHAPATAGSKSIYVCSIRFHHRPALIP